MGPQRVDDGSRSTTQKFLQPSAATGRPCRKISYIKNEHRSPVKSTTCKGPWKPEQKPSSSRMSAGRGQGSVAAKASIRAATAAAASSRASGSPCLAGEHHRLCWRVVLSGGFTPARVAESRPEAVEPD